MVKAREIPADHAAPDLYPLAFRFDERFGRCVGVGLAGANGAGPACLRKLLHPEERALCEAMKGARLVEWVGGRVASKLARAGVPGGELPTLRSAGGAPQVGAGIAISLSHTRGLAVALAGFSRGWSVGVDVETIEIEDTEERLLKEKVLSREERRVAISGGCDIATVQRFSIKEAAYKAVFSLTGRPTPLSKITVHRLAGSRDEFQISVPAENVLVEAVSLDVAGHVLSLARASRPHDRVGAAQDLLARRVRSESALG